MLSEIADEERLPRRHLRSSLLQSSASRLQKPPPTIGSFARTERRAGPVKPDGTRGPSLTSLQCALSRGSLFSSPRLALVAAAPRRPRNSSEVRLSWVHDVAVL